MKAYDVHARDPGRPQRVLRSRLPQCRGRAHDIKRNPFHPVLVLRHGDARGRGARPDGAGKGACTVAGFQWDSSDAHSAAYDAERTADLFCEICNRLSESYRAAEQRACSLGWYNAPPSEPAN